jgi:peroxiredoxin
MESSSSGNKKIVAGCVAGVFVALVGVTYAVVLVINHLRAEPERSEKIARVQAERERERLEQRQRAESQPKRHYTAEAPAPVAQKSTNAAVLPPTGEAAVELRSITNEYARLGASYPPGKPYALVAEKPAEVLRAPAGENIHYGRIPLGEQPVWFAIAPQKVKGQKATLFVDRNRDGDFTNDKPASYEGTGTSYSAGVLTVDIQRADGSSFPYAIWLWTTFDGTASAQKPGFNFYSRSYKRAALRLPDGTDVAVLAGDPKNTGVYDSGRVLIDWNGNQKPDEPEWIKPGQTQRRGNVALTLREIAPFSDSIRLEVNAAGANAAEDVGEALARVPNEGNLPPDVGVDTAGRAVQWNEYRGKVVLVDFWATWCAPCVREMPAVKAAYEKYRSRGFEIVGVSLDKDVSRLNAFVEQQQIAWRQVCDGQSWASPVAKRWHVESIPATFLIGKDGTISRVGLRGEMLEKAIEEELAKK